VGHSVSLDARDGRRAGPSGGILFRLGADDRVPGNWHPLTPLRLELVQPASPLRHLQRHFGCPVVYEATRNAIIFREADVVYPFVTQNAELREIWRRNLTRNSKTATMSLSSSWYVAALAGVTIPPWGGDEAGTILRMPTAFRRSPPRLVPMNTQSGILCRPARANRFLHSNRNLYNHTCNQYPGAQLRSARCCSSRPAQ
jgi:hypothetical protein